MALAPKIRDRFARLLTVGIDERESVFLDDVRMLDRTAASRGTFHDGSHFANMSNLHESELGVRTEIAWQCLVRAFESSGSPISEDLAQDLKSVLQDAIISFANRLNQSLQAYVARLPAGARSDRTDLDAPARHLIRKHDVEIEIYVESVVSRRDDQGSTSAQYNFYGAVGAVQTGANAQANVVQNMSGPDKSALVEAIQLAQDAIERASELERTKQLELLDIASECKVEVVAEAPNSTKLLTMLHVLATSIQTVASAKPAYQALRVALLPLGVTLP